MVAFLAITRADVQTTAGQHLEGAGGVAAEEPSPEGAD
jgi:hypothetical protein